MFAVSSVDLVSVNYLPADGQYLLQHLNTLSQFSEVTSHISVKEYALQSLLSPACISAALNQVYTRQISKLVYSCSLFVA